MEILIRLGTFFILVGIAMLTMFLGSILSKDVHVIYLLLAILALLAGIRLRRDRPATDSGRFGALRRARERSRQRRDERIQKKHFSRGGPSDQRSQESK